LGGWQIFMVGLHYSGSMHPLDTYNTSLRALAEQALRRQCRTVSTSPAGLWPVVAIDGKTAIDFCSNNYLGLANHPALTTASTQATQQYGTSARAARLISGTTPLTTELEQAIAQFKGTEAALVFNSGYQGNLAILQAVLDKHTHVFFDRLNHASLIDGVLLSGAQWQRYRHLDTDHLETLLQKIPVEEPKWIVTDSVFSMDGDCADLPHIMALAKQYNAMVMIDEAHGTGVFGNTKCSGLAEAQGVSDQIALQFGTFSKALGSFGAYVAGPQVLIDTIMNKGRGFIYSTALPPGVLAANLTALQLIQSDTHLKDRLWHNVATFQDALTPHAPAFPHPILVKSPIIPMVLGERAMAVSEALLDQGYFVQAIRSPTVAKGSERLRITLSAAHTQDHILGLVTALVQTLG